MSDGLDIQFLRDSYQRMIDKDILQIARKDINDLTPEARQVLEEELLKRNLDPNINESLPQEIQTDEEQTATPKSFEFALLFAFIFGPFGILYVSATYGIILIILGVLAFALLGYIGLAIIWIISIIVAFQTSSKTKGTTKVVSKTTTDRESLLN
ncbi:MAG: hypothetical protein AAB212_11250, partial [Bacteroidota bacterium]